MGHYCRICGRHRPNQRFSGKGHARHICRECQGLPRATLFRIEALNEIEGILFRQSCISKKNLNRMGELAACNDEEVRSMAEIVMAIGLAHPGRRHRYRWIKANQPGLWQRMIQVGIVEEWVMETGDDSVLDTLPIDEPFDHEAGHEHQSRSDDDDIPF